MRGIPVTELVELAEFAGAERDGQSPKIFFQVVAPHGPRNRDDLAPLREYPSECELAGRAAFAGR